jgi:type IV pilus assembly protein PilV
MLSNHPNSLPRQLGTSLVEVMVTLAILAFALLGIAGLQSKIGTAEMESYQRAQALVALSQMTERLSANTANAPAYVTAGAVGTGDAEPADCVGAGLTGAALDLCEWSNALKGSAETKGGASVGAMMSGRGCIIQVQAPVSLPPGNCTAGIYRVSVVWQGMAPTAVPPGAAPVLACGTGLYGASDAWRRLISATVPVPTTSCY